MNAASVDCWEWNGARNDHGYGVKRFRGKARLTHRIAWEWANGNIPAGLFVLHRCDNPPCCNPDHLFVGTQLANIRDALSKGRMNMSGLRPYAPPRRRFCSRGHEFTAHNTIVKPVGRSCRSCSNEMQRQRRLAKKVKA